MTKKEMIALISLEQKKWEKIRDESIKDINETKKIISDDFNKGFTPKLDILVEERCKHRVEALEFFKKTVEIYELQKKNKKKYTNLK